MHMVPVQDRCECILISIESGECKPLEIVEHVIDLGIAWVVFCRPGNHAGRVSVHGRQRRRDCGHDFGLAAQHFDGRSNLPVVVTISQKVLHRAMGIACAMAKKFEVHTCYSRLRDGFGIDSALEVSSDRCRSMRASALSNSIPDTAVPATTCLFNARAIWFALDPIAASWRMSKGSARLTPPTTSGLRFRGVGLNKGSTASIFSRCRTTSDSERSSVTSLRSKRHTEPGRRTVIGSIGSGDMFAGMSFSKSNSRV